MEVQSMPEANPESWSADALELAELVALVDIFAFSYLFSFRLPDQNFCH
jgi:hypothetical protein